MYLLPPCVDLHKQATHMVPDLIDDEASAFQDPHAVAIEVTAASHGLPRWCEPVLYCCEGAIVQAHVFHRSQQAARLEHPADLADNLLGLIRRTQHQRDDSSVEALVFEWQILTFGRDEMCSGVTVSLTGASKLSFVWIDSDNLDPRWVVGQRCSGADPNFENSTSQTGEQTSAHVAQTRRFEWCHGEVIACCSYLAHVGTVTTTAALVNGLNR